MAAWLSRVWDIWADNLRSRLVHSRGRRAEGCPGVNLHTHTHTRAPLKLRESFLLCCCCNDVLETRSLRLLLRSATPDQDATKLRRGSDFAEDIRLRGIRSLRV